MKRYIATLFLLMLCINAHAQSDILIEAESFANKGGWSVDQQFTFEMGSPYLIAHGMGRTVEDASMMMVSPSSIIAAARRAMSSFTAE